MKSFCKQHFLYHVIVFVLVATVIQPAKGETSVVPHSYAITSSNEEVLFVMIAPSDETDGLGLPAEERAKSLQIRAKYRQSGLFLNNGSTTPLWKVDWYASRVYLNPDSIHLMRMGAWATKPSDEALSFFEKDKLLKSYKVEDLVDVAWLLPHSVSHFDWEREIRIDETTNTVSVKTILYDQYVFDFKTGQAVSSRRFSRVVFSATVILLLALFVLIINSIRKNRRRRDN